MNSSTLTAVGAAVWVGFVGATLRRGRRSVDVSARRAARRGFHQPASPRCARPVALSGRNRWVVAGLVCLASVVVAGLALTVLGVVIVASSMAWWNRSRRKRADHVAAAAVPDLVDLFVVAVSAGLPVPSALQAVAPRAPRVLRPAVQAAAASHRGGAPIAQVLDDLADRLGPAARPLTDALQRGAATGVPLVPLLAGVAAAAAEQRREHARAAARRLPVQMLYPLTMCILPAAIALAVVPVVAASLAALRS